MVPMVDADANLPRAWLALVRQRAERTYAELCHASSLFTNFETANICLFQMLTRNIRENMFKLLNS